MGLAKDLTGKRFGMLTVVKRATNTKLGKACWLCKCDCGNETVVRSHNLLSHITKSCGCLQREHARKMQKKNWKLATQKAYIWNKKNDWIDGTSLFSIINPPRKDNSSGVRGVSWNKKRSEWVAYITFQQRRFHLGWFTEKEDAIKARKEAEEKYFKPVIKKYKTSVER